MAQIQNKSEDVGKILVKVHEDLRQLKEQVDLFKISGKDIDAKAIEEAIKRTERGLQRNANQLFHTISNKMQTLPAIGEGGDKSTAAASKEHLTADLIHKSPSKPAVPTLSPGERECCKTREKNREKYSCMSLASYQLHEGLTMKALLDPENFNNRLTLNKTYGLVLPKIKSANKNKQEGVGQIVRAPLCEHPGTLPAANRKDPSLPPPPINDKDARKGILSLINRGLIPASAELTLDPSPVHMRRATLHDHQSICNNRRELVVVDDSAQGEDNHYMASAKLDMPPPSPNPLNQLVTTTTTSSHQYDGGYHLLMERAPQKEELEVKVQHLSIEDFQRRPNTAAQQRQLALVANNNNQQVALHDDDDDGDVINNDDVFLIHRARLPEDSAFDEFKRANMIGWGGISDALNRLQRLLQAYNITRAFVVKQKLVALASHYELEQNPDKFELLSVLYNLDEVTALINKPGRRYRSSVDGVDRAAVKIQATWRRYAARKRYMKYRRQRWASGLIAVAWIMSKRRVATRERVRECKAARLDNFFLRRNQLAKEWASMKSGRRVIVHVPSLNLPMQDRRNMKTNFNQQQNLQIGRIFDLLDPNVSIIYVSGVDMGAEVTSYYNKLLSLRGAVGSGRPDDVIHHDVTSRVTFVHTEAATLFSKHSMSLATLLRYSPVALRRIRQLILGRKAYYLPSLIGEDDVAVADILNIPVLGSDPEVARLYSSKSGSKRILSSAKVECPPGEYDVYTAQQLHECLAKLVCANPNIRKWIIKIDSTFDGRGIAFIDVQQNLKCYEQLQKQVKKFGDKWKYKWAQEETLSKVMYELPSCLDNFAQPVDARVFPKWVNFLEAFLSKGGIIEAYPPCSVTCLTVDMVIEVDGEVKMLACGDQIHAESPLKCFATSLPQTSVDPEVLSSLCWRVAGCCKKRGIVGNFSLDFVTFMQDDDEQKIWCTDLTVAYSEQLSLTKCMLYLTDGELHATRSNFTISSPIKEDKLFVRNGQKPQEEKKEHTRFAVMSAKLFHSNLAVVRHNVFFQICRAHGIGYDIRERKGTIFFLIHPEKRARLAMIVIGDNLKESLDQFGSNLYTIDQEVSGPNMPGLNNFTPALHDIDQVLKQLHNPDEDGE